MTRSPTLADHLFNVAFFVVCNALLFGAAWLKGRRAQGVFRWAYVVPVAPLIVMVWMLSWQWLFDATAANLWPLGMLLLAVPCWLAWLVLLRLEAWTAQRRERRS